tara:strand:+ start:1771 stop:2547 length:777 start_codon:yes stop_codon:yes gene_type:complete
MSIPFETLEVSGKIYKVYPHDELYYKLERIYGNRTIVDNDVLNIKKSIERNNLLHLQPIIIQILEDTFKIIDGQHRLEAALLLGIPFHIIVDTSSNILNLITLNTHQRKWELPDFLNFWCSRKETSYVYNMYKQYKKENLVSNSVLIAIFNKSVEYAKASWEFKDGKLRYDSFNQEHIKDTLIKIKRVQKCPTNPTLDINVLDRKPFQLALLAAFENTTFDFEKFLDNLKRSRHRFNILAKKTDYTKEIFRIERKRKS